MPIIVNPSFVWPTSQDPIVSPDGIISALPDEWAGVALKADYSAVEGPKPQWVIFMRRLDEQAVRGGDPSRLVSDVGYAYDHEVSFGVNRWYAIPVYPDGTIGAPSQTVAVNVPEPATGTSDPSTWIKSLEDPALSVQVSVDTWPQFDYEIPSEITHIEGRRNSFVSYDVMSGVTTNASFYAGNAEDSEKLYQCFLGGGIFYIHSSTTFHRPEFYCVATQISRVDRANVRYDIYTWNLSLVEVDRPPTKNLPNRVPGHSLWDRYKQFPTFADIPVRTFESTRML